MPHRDNDYMCHHSRIMFTPIVGKKKKKVLFFFLLFIVSYATKQCPESSKRELAIIYLRSSHLQPHGNSRHSGAGMKDLFDQ